MAGVGAAEVFVGAFVESVCWPCSFKSGEVFVGVCVGVGLGEAFVDHVR